MKWKLIILVSGLLLCSHPTVVRAQTSSSLIEKLESVTQEKEPEWKLDRKLPTEKIIVLRWSSGEARVFMSVTMTDSSDMAKGIYDGSVARLNDQFGPSSSKSKVPNLGAENQLWTRDQSDGSAAIQFRQGKVHVLLFAPSGETAKRFAFYVADVLQPAKASQAAKSSPAWKEFSSAEGRFSILFPGDPVLETKVIDAAPGVQFHLHVHTVKTGVECSVMYADYPIEVSDPAVVKRVLDDGAKGAVASVNSELLELKEITLDGHPGRYLKERMPGGEIMEVKMIMVGQRLYQVAITLPRDDGASATRKASEKMADKFLSSFKLRKKG